MQFFCQDVKIIKKLMIAKNIFSYNVLCPEIAQAAQPGQFVQIQVPPHFLRRPISICDINKADGTIRLVFEIRGEGTFDLANYSEGDLMSIVAPLGVGFTIVPSDKKIVVIGGGIGVPPMLEVAKSFGENASAIIGFRNKDFVILDKDFENNKNNVYLCTDDGSIGEKGLVTAPLARLLEQQKIDMIYACGPNPMLKGIIELADKYNVKCEVSLEQRMACGVGACLVCACKAVIDGKQYMLQVCKHGPVFSSKKVVFD